MASGSITSRQVEGGKEEAVTDFLFLGSEITADGDCSHEIRRQLLLGRKAMANLDSVLKSRDITLLDKGPYSQGYGLPSGHIRLWELDRKEGRMPKNWCLWAVVLEKTPESPLDGKEIKPVNLKGDQPWIFTGRTDAEAEALVFWSPDATYWKSPWCWETLRAEGEEGIRGWDDWTAPLMQWTWTWANSRRRWGTGRPGVLHAVHGIAKSWTRLGDWTTTTQPQRQWTGLASSIHKSSSIEDYFSSPTHNTIFVLLWPPYFT